MVPLPFCKHFHSPNFNPSVDDDKWWPLLPSSPIQNKAILCPGTPEAYLGLKFNSLSYCISFHLKLLDRDFYLFMYFFGGDSKHYWFPWHGCVAARWDNMGKKLLWIKSGKRAAFLPAEGQNHPSLFLSFPLCALCSPAAKWWVSIYCCCNNIFMDCEHRKLQQGKCNQTYR